MSPASSGTSADKGKWVIEDRDLVGWEEELIPHIYGDAGFIQSMKMHFELGWELSSVEYGVIYLHHPGGHRLIPDKSDRRFRLVAS